jgi:hypothetical protein
VSARQPAKKYFCPMCEAVESDTPGGCPKCLGTGFGAIGFDLLYLTLFSVVAMSAATMLFRRTL